MRDDNSAHGPEGWACDVVQAGGSMTEYDLKHFQNLDTDSKILETIRLLIEYYEKHEGKITISFSGGIDSKVMLHIARILYPDIKAVFSDTGLEYPEIRDFVFKHDNVDVVRPKMHFGKVIDVYGYPVISKKVSRFISDVQNPTAQNINVRNLRLTGMSSVTQPGKYMPSMKIPEKWMYLTAAPFKVSDKCCDMLKKEPLSRYEKEHGTKRVIGIMADESDMRKKQAKMYGPVTDKYLAPLIFWSRNDILTYILENKINYCSIYGEIVEDCKGNLDTTGEHRTGCMFCMFGVHLEKHPNRFERMKISHPKHHTVCMNLGCGKVMDYIGVTHG